MLKTGKSLDALRKKLHNFEKNDILDDRIAVVTYHPLQLIINRKLKYFAWDDLKWIQKELQKNRDR
jgi:uracil-DNA glycosylase